MKQHFAVLAILLIFLPSLEAEESASKVIRERIEWLDTNVEETVRNDLPRVLFIGDSISAGYRGPAKQALKGKVYFGFLCTSAALGDPALFDQMKLLVGQYHFDVIHFNVGMHGWGYSEDDYRAAFSKLLALLKEKAPTAQLIWASTTPCRMNGPKFEQFDPKNERIKARNRIAAELVGQKGIPINDLYALEENHPERSKDGVHFSDEGKAAQGKQVAKFITEALSVGRKGMVSSLIGSSEPK